MLYAHAIALALAIAPQPHRAPASAPKVGTAVTITAPGRYCPTGPVTIAEDGRVTCVLRKGQRLDVLMRWRPTVAEQRDACDHRGGRLWEDPNGTRQVCRGVDY